MFHIDWDLAIKSCGLIVIILGVINFYAQRKIKRGEWLKSLFEKFYEAGSTKMLESGLILTH